MKNTVYEKKSIKNTIIFFFFFRSHYLIKYLDTKQFQKKIRDFKYC